MLKLNDTKLTFPAKSYPTAYKWSYDFMYLLNSLKSNKKIIVYNKIIKKW